MTHGKKNLLSNYLVILPLVAIVALFTIYPVVQAIQFSLRKYYLIRPGRPFIGLENYVSVVSERLFPESVFSTLLFTGGSVAGAFLLGLGIALLLSYELRFSGALKTLIVLPWALPYTIGGLIWKLIFAPDFGLINKTLGTLGLVKPEDYVAWLTDPRIAQMAVILAQIWREMPFATIFILAGLQAIPPDYYDAVEIDGGGAWTRLVHIALPLLKPIILIVLVYETIIALITFDLVYIMTGGGPAGATSLLSYYAYSKSFSFLNFGEGTALSMILTGVIAVILFVLLKIISPSLSKS